jgi:hypothetical protein
MEVRVAFATFVLTDDVKQFAKEKSVTLLQRRGKVFETLAA